MKKTFLFATAVLFTAFTYAQKPGNSGRGFQYQAVARDANGNIRQNQQIDIKFSFSAGVNASTIHWAESHAPTTDAYGTFSVIIGEGTKDENSLYASFKLLSFAIDWWLKVEIKVDGGWLPLSNQKLLSVPYAENVAPIGTIEIFAGPSTSVPFGYRVCDGTAIDRSKYPELYDVIKTSWGTGNGSTTFNIPDLRGVFIRGVSNGTGNDPDRSGRPSRNGGNAGDKVGSYQSDQLASHNHSYQSAATKDVSGDGGRSPFAWNPANYSTGYTGGNETRPKNVYVNYIIKVK